MLSHVVRISIKGVSGSFNSLAITLGNYARRAFPNICTQETSAVRDGKCCVYEGMTNKNMASTTIKSSPPYAQAQEMQALLDATARLQVIRISKTILPSLYN